jgi:hypothetical protein
MGSRNEIRIGVSGVWSSVETNHLSNPTGWLDVAAVWPPEATKDDVPEALTGLVIAISKLEKLEESFGLLDLRPIDVDWRSVPHEPVSKGSSVLVECRASSFIEIRLVVQPLEV